jgi:hypothetical protein
MAVFAPLGDDFEHLLGKFVYEDSCTKVEGKSMINRQNYRNNFEWLFQYTSAGS